MLAAGNAMLGVCVFSQSWAIQHSRHTCIHLICNPVIALECMPCMYQEFAQEFVMAALVDIILQHISIKNGLDVLKLFLTLKH